MKKVKLFASVAILVITMVCISGFQATGQSTMKDDNKSMSDSSKMKKDMKHDSKKDMKHDHMKMKNDSTKMKKEKM